MLDLDFTDGVRPTAGDICTELARIDAERVGSFAAAPGPARTLAVVYTHWSFADDEHPLFGPLVRAVTARAMRSGADVVLCLPSRNHWLDAAAVERVLAHGADGLIVLGGADGNPAVLTGGASGLPAVFLEYDPLGQRSVHVGISNEKAFTDLVIHLATLGRVRIATITGPLDMRVASERLAAYRRALDRFGYPIRPEYIEVADFLESDGYTATLRLLALPEPPDAIAAACDVQAAGAIRAVEELGLRCPEDVAVTGFDDASWARLMTPALTTIRQPAAEMGAAAVDVVLQMIEEPGVLPRPVELPARLVVRESCGAHLPVRV
jgi:LacI family transcriptional regulator, galactose operon repressor